MSYKSSYYQEDREVSDWNRTKESLDICSALLEVVSDRIIDYLGREITILGVQDIRIGALANNTSTQAPSKPRTRHKTRSKPEYASNGQVRDQAFHQDASAPKRELLVLAVDFLNRPLNTDIIIGTHGERKNKLYMRVWAYNQDNKGILAAKYQPFESKEIVRIESSVCLFDPTVYHRGTSQTPKAGHRLFITMKKRSATNVPTSFVKSLHIEAPWCLDVDLQPLNIHDPIDAVY